MNLALSLFLLGCGKTPEDVAGATKDGTGGSRTSMGGNLADSGQSPPRAASGAPAFACNSTAEPGETVSVPAAAFDMGCAKADATCRDDEKPAHAVSVSAFEIDKTEVTQDAYAACVQDKACDAPSCAWDCDKPTLPARCVEREQAAAYCKWAGKRLPTEAEWELAARGTDGRQYPWGNDAPDCTRANLLGCASAPDAVGSHPAGASPYGAVDMAGNVVEMVADWYDPSFYQASPAKDPTGPASGTRYVGRGGGYESEAIWQRASSRDWYDVTDESDPLGFRCAR